MEGVTQEGKPYSCKTCNKCFAVLSQLKNHAVIHSILVRNLTHVHIAIKCSVGNPILRFMKRFTLEKNFTLARHAINVSMIQVVWRNMNWSILMRNVTHVVTVLKCSQRKPMWRDMKRFTPEKNLTLARHAINELTHTGMREGMQQMF